MTSRRRLAVAPALAAAVLALTACGGGAPPAIEVTPVDGPFDPVDVRVTGLAPGATITLTATTRVDDMPFDSRATFAADANGRIDLATTAPASGSWTTADPMGPFWSMSSVSRRWWSVFDEPYVVALAVVDASGETLAEVTVDRPGTAPGVETRPMEASGVIGAYTLPADHSGEPLPAALVLGGSEGGLETAMMTAQWIAGLGYPALAVSYFDEPGQPTELENVPIEPVLTALEWLHAQPEVDTDALFTFGYSRGGELALWLAAEHPDRVAGAFAPVGSGYLVCGVPDLSAPAWILGGEPLSAACAREIGREPPAGSLIDVAAIDGPVVLACGGEDALWPSCPLMDDIVARRGSAETIAVPGDGASHFVSIPPGVPGLDPEIPVEIHSATHAVRRAFWDAAADVFAAASR
ncbi:acyl-CoA thioesterase/BAAT N-terminal domain-containing protein [Microbacterium sp. 2FI]|uniref:acyl-CoA thioesterase/BAAT N-terminal domain-containing protein n=1 Tax=Microbacterium sp. 2FI TaxID=2502193 RepID=UPI0010F7329A|nr:acyl-CoA thioesterase/BAAT N-terminal domain-containing protein [Microbacterium sp. 2FI]